MHTILGAGGAIGVLLARELVKDHQKIRLVSRNPQKVNPGDELIAADLTNPEEVYQAVDGSEVVYLTAGLPYRAKVWKARWPVIMKNVIEACKTVNARLVFFDNIYMYDKDCLNPMDETTPINPPSKKGKVRAEIAKMLMDEVNQGNIQALIARAADFYGPGIKNNSILTEMVFENLSKGKKANWLGALNYRHSFTYTPDAAKAVAILGKTADAYGEIWHLPTASNPLTGKQWVEAIAKAMNVKPKTQVASKLMVRILGLFMGIMREMVEMFYQYDRPYVFDSNKFEKRFDFKPTPYSAGIETIIEQDYR
ncbi:MAG: NAD-dependent epimerase/dehydratase family protein [Bacteroidales bacterium]|jgi:nucleoside-diphosphate-sugar epimerase|nr:NAD-dependent epimerase/dehydratase family protein [Bacteroidales bacterium]